MSDEIIIESIKKLMSLNMSDDEIIGSLIDAGVDYETAQASLDEVKYKKNETENKKRVIDSKDKITETKDIAENTPEDDDNENTSEEDSDNLEDTSLGIWQEGVLTTINQKLDEIEQKGENLDKNIEQKVQNITETEIKKMKIILDSQRTLLLSKINSSLDSQIKEITTKLDAALQNIQKINRETQQKLDELSKSKEKIDTVQSNLIAQMDEFNKIRDKTQEIVENMKTKMETEVKSISEQYDLKISEVDKKLNNAISLSTKILDSLVIATKKKLESYYDKTSEEIIAQIKERINKEDYLKDQKEDYLIKLEGMEKTIETKVNQKVSEYLAKLTEIDTRLNEVRNINNNIEDTIAIKVDDYFAKKKFGAESSQESIIDLNKRLAEIENRLKSKPKDDFEVNAQTLEELVLFKEQYAKLFKKLNEDVAKLKKKQE